MRCHLLKIYYWITDSKILEEPDEDQIKKAHILQSMVDGRKKVPPLQSQVKAMVETTILGEAFVYFDGRPNSAQFLRAAIRPPKSCFV